MASLNSAVAKILYDNGALDVGGQCYVAGDEVDLAGGKRRAGRCTGVNNPERASEAWWGTS
jgi:hypothetical protein